MTARRPDPPPEVERIARRLEDAGFETWTVGGAVRDALAGRPSGDWDLTTRARPGDMKKVFGRVVPIGVRHGTVGVMGRDGTLYEVTTFRRDVETDGRHAVVAFADRIEDDLCRRDFTINAIAWHPLRRELMDPHGGRSDLADGVLRTVGAAGERFAEDYLRILRALRFAGRYGLTIHHDTWVALQSDIEGLRGLSAERVREELLKVLEHRAEPSTSLRLYRDSGALGVLYPELAELPDGVWEQTSAAVDALPADDGMLRLAMLLRPLPAADAAAVLVRLRLSNRATDRVARLAGSPAPPPADTAAAGLRGWLGHVGRDYAADVVLLCRAEAAVGNRDPDSVTASWTRARVFLTDGTPLTPGDLDVDGRDLIRLGLRPGPRFGKILDHLLRRVLEDPDRNRKRALEHEALRYAEELERDADG